MLWVVTESQSLSGWDGVFHYELSRAEIRGRSVAIPFRVGWGFSLGVRHVHTSIVIAMSQSLSGWDGVFHRSRLGRR